MLLRGAAMATPRKTEDNVRRGAALRKLRTDLGMRAAEVALQVGASQGTYEHWESGRTAITPVAERALAQALGIPPDRLAKVLSGPGVPTSVGKDVPLSELEWRMAVLTELRAIRLSVEMLARD
jgi:transcriptional regulator with XRE-family HTH domain